MLLKTFSVKNSIEIPKVFAKAMKELLLRKRCQIVELF